MTTSSSPSPTAPFFPLSRFISLAGVHTLLLLFSALYLPRSSFLLSALPEQASSKDRPQHAFLRPLTADPLLTLFWLCIGAAVVQASWAGWLKGEEGSAKLALFGEDDEAKLKRAATMNTDRMKALKDAAVATLSSSIFFHVAITLFGAPFIGLIWKTYLFALLLSILTVYPAAYTLKPPSLRTTSNQSESSMLAHRLLWLRLFAEVSPRTPYERLLVYPSIGALVGAWVGVFPIPLDWDRPWQVWPLTPAFGAIVGYAIGVWWTLILEAVYILASHGREAEANEARKMSVPISGKKKKSGGVKVVGKTSK